MFCNCYGFHGWNQALKLWIDQQVRNLLSKAMYIFVHTWLSQMQKDAKISGIISLHTIIWSLHSRFFGVANCFKTCSTKFSPLILRIWRKSVSFCMIIRKEPRKPKKTMKYFIFFHMMSLYSIKALKIISEWDHFNLDQCNVQCKTLNHQFHDHFS